MTFVTMARPCSRTGNAIYLLHPDGRKEHLLSEAMIEQVFFGLGKVALRPHNPAIAR
jgi:hypothetical protein